jgi:hypothetical protein
MRQRIVLSIALMFCVAPVVPADILYLVTVNTNSITGTAGSLDFQFNPGPLISQAASVKILSFASNGTLIGPPFKTGDASGGPLPTTVSLDNGTQYNDYFEAFTFGTSLSFNLRLSGPAVQSPDGISTSGSTFAFSMFSDAAGTVPTLTSDPNGFAARVDINLNGTSTAASPSSQTTIGLAPEPGSFALTAISIVLAGGFVWRRRR